MSSKSALVGLLMLMIGCGCAAGNYKDYKKNTGDNLTMEDNSTGSRSGGVGIWPFLVGYFMGSRGASAPGAVQAPEKTDNKDTKNINSPRGVGQQSDLTARGSGSMRGSMGS